MPNKCTFATIHRLHANRKYFSIYHNLWSNERENLTDHPIKLPVLPKKHRSSGEPKDFIDYKRVVCCAGKGADGRISFRRGPDGGNGGNGGHVIFKADSSVTDLSKIDTILRASNGTKSEGHCCHGRNGEHLYVSVPLNTIIRKKNEISWELAKEDDIFIGARGGAGGHGNAFYLSNMVRKPLKAELGGLGEKVAYEIEMRVMATAGFVGFPNAGKSSISRAKPRVAAYPFTTIKPSIGMVQYGDFFQVPVADIPGLIGGSHKNEGLGFSFLQHIKRCECILYVLDCTRGDLYRQWESLNTELKLYDQKLMKKEFAIVLNKIDVGEESELRQIGEELFPGQQLFYVSGKYRIGLDPMLMYIRKKYEQFLKNRDARVSNG